MTDLPVKQPSVMRRRLRIALSGLHVIDIRAVRCRDDVYNARDLLRLSGVDRLDVSMSMRRSEDLHDAGIRRHVIFDEYTVAAHQRRTVHLLSRFAYNVQMRPEGRRRLCSVSAAVHALYGELYSQIIMLISCVTDEDAGHGFFDGFPVRVRIIHDQPGKEQGSRRCIICTADNTGIHHGLLDQSQARTGLFAIQKQGTVNNRPSFFRRTAFPKEIFGQVNTFGSKHSQVTKSVRSHDLRILSRRSRDEVGVDRFTIHKNRVGTAEPFKIIRITHTVVSVISKDFLKTPGRICFITSRDMIDRKIQFHTWSPPSPLSFSYISSSVTPVI